MTTFNRDSNIGCGNSIKWDESLRLILVDEVMRVEARENERNASWETRGPGSKRKWLRVAARMAPHILKTGVWSRKLVPRNLKHIVRAQFVQIWSSYRNEPSNRLVNDVEMTDKLSAKMEAFRWFKFQQRNRLKWWYLFERRNCLLGPRDHCPNVEKHGEAELDGLKEHEEAELEGLKEHEEAEIDGFKEHGRAEFDGFKKPGEAGLNELKEYDKAKLCGLKGTVQQNWTERNGKISVQRTCGGKISVQRTCGDIGIQDDVKICKLKMGGGVGQEDENQKVVHDGDSSVTQGESAGSDITQITRSNRSPLHDVLVENMKALAAKKNPTIKDVEENILRTMLTTYRAFCECRNQKL